MPHATTCPALPRGSGMWHASYAMSCLQTSLSATQQHLASYVPQQLFPAGAVSICVVIWPAISSLRSMGPLYRQLLWQAGEPRERGGQPDAEQSHPVQGWATANPGGASASPWEHRKKGVG